MNNHDFLQLQLSESHLREVIASEKRAQDAKNPQKKFSVEARNQVYQSLETFYGDDLQNGMQWMTQNNPHVKLVPSLSSALAL